MAAMLFDIRYTIETLTATVVRLAGSSLQVGIHLTNTVLRDNVEDSKSLSRRFCSDNYPSSVGK